MFLLLVLAVTSGSPIDGNTKVASNKTTEGSSQIDGDRRWNPAWSGSVKQESSYDRIPTYAEPNGYKMSCHGDSWNCQPGLYCDNNICKWGRSEDISCMPWSRCPLDAGDCDSNSACKGDLECGKGNCPWSSWGSPDDCCIKPKEPACKTCSFEKPAEKAPVRDASWTKWTNDNQKGHLNNVCECAEGKYVTEMTWREQPHFGFIDLKLKCSDGVTCNANSNEGGVHGKDSTPMKCDEGFGEITGMEQHHYGIVNVKGYCLNSHEQKTGTDNNNGSWKVQARCKMGQRIVAVEPREHDGYGLINFRVKCA